MKISRTQQEVTVAGVTLTMKKLSASALLNIQSRSVKMKNITAGMTKEAVAQNTELDSEKFRGLKFINSIEKWDIETEDSTTENMKFLPIDENALKVIDGETFTAIEAAINKFSEPTPDSLKN